MCRQDDATAQQALPAKKAAKTKQDRAAAAAEKAAAREVEAEEAKRRAELELLLMDEDSLRLAPPQPSGGRHTLPHNAPMWMHCRAGIMSAFVVCYP